MFFCSLLSLDPSFQPTLNVKTKTKLLLSWQQVVGNHVVDACMATNFQWTIDGSEADDERGSAGSSSLYDSSIVVTSRTAFYDVREKEGDALYHNELKVVDEEGMCYNFVIKIIMLANRLAFSGENIETNSYAEKCNRFVFYKLKY